MQRRGMAKITDDCLEEAFPRLKKWNNSLMENLMNCSLDEAKQGWVYIYLPHTKHSPNMQGIMTKPCVKNLLGCMFTTALEKETANIP